MEDQQTELSEQNTKMKELKLEEDENVKEISMEEDILGAHSLLLSESDEEENVGNIFNSKKSPQKKIIKKTKRILDSDSEDDVGNKPTTAQVSEEKKLINKNIISTLIDSDSDVDTSIIHTDVEETLQKLNNIEYTLETQEISKVDFKLLRKNLKNFKIHQNGKRNEESENSNSDTISSKKKSIKKRKNSKKDKNIDAANTKFSLVDSETSDAEPEKEIKISDFEISANKVYFEENNEENPKSKDKEKKVVRASAKKAMDEMQAIQSEQQRLYREAHISVPYHKPRKYTLDEFLNRRTIIKPEAASPASAILTKNLKMNSDELEEYANLMEERAKEAKEFFKSESENEDEIFKTNEGVLEKSAEITQHDQSDISQKTYVSNEVPIQEKRYTDDNLKNGVQLTKNENVPDEKKGAPASPKVLITEIIELPKLDMNTVRISPVKKQLPPLSYNIKQLLAQKNLSGSPSLSGDPNKLIDLETGDIIDKKPVGMDNLIKRLMSSVKKTKAKNSETCNILSLENGKLEVSKVNVSSKESKDFSMEMKPGAAYFELKRNLKEIIKKKRLEEIIKKQENESEYSKCFEDKHSDDSDEVENFKAYDLNDRSTTKVIMVDEEENSLLVSDVCDEEEYNVKETEGGDFEAYDENEPDIDEDRDADNEAESDEESDVEPVNKTQRKSRIIRAFDDTDEEGENDDIDFLKTQPPHTQPSLHETQTSLKAPLEDEENELMALCSGTFDESQKFTSNVNALMSQIPITQNRNKQLNDKELMELCSGTFDQRTQEVQTSQSEETLRSIVKKGNIILSSDGENDSQLSKNEKNEVRVKKFSKSLRNKRTKLGFSDEEEIEESGHEENDEVDDEMDKIDDIVEIASDEPETFVDYDSEENEILVQMTKKDKVKVAQNFVENEAELSESEWGSADEDENNLDKYDIELGDEDEFDKEKLRTELGQIHARKMLDEDIREVRKIQELLFEDEENDGVGRQRTFKWKNAESGFNLDEGRQLNESGDIQNGNSDDEINEHQWRKIRYEREQFLKEQGLKLGSQDSSAIDFNSGPTNITTTKKLQIITSKKTAFSLSNTKNISQFLISKGATVMHKKSVRGSFLVRDSETLNKLAGLTKCTPSATGTAGLDATDGTVTIKNIKPKNFVFATLTEEEHENLKRKADELLNSSTENGKNFMKRPKFEPRRDKCFIDQLL